MNFKRNYYPKCCGENIPKYRAELYLDINYNKQMTQKQLEFELKKFDKSNREILKKLVPYCKIADFTIKWYACEKCIEPELIKYFTYYPEGWKENIKDNKPYEKVKLLSKL